MYDNNNIMLNGSINKNVSRAERVITFNFCMASKAHTGKYLNPACFGCEAVISFDLKDKTNCILRLKCNCETVIVSKGHGRI